jgi:tape measure domain-containing protein
MAETNEFFIRVGADVEDAKNKLNQLGNQLSQLANSTQRSGSMIGGSMNDASKQISSAFGAMGMALTTAGITAGLIAFGKNALSTAAELEQTSVAFEVFTGSAETASKMLAQLKAQALKSPMQFLDITKGAQILLQYGLTAEQVIPITQMLGDVSAGNADKFNRLALAFGQVNASGRLMGQEARQMINAGFNPLQAISDKTGASMAVLTQRMHDGQISVKEVGDAFIAATSEGGRFFGMADKQSQTLQGAFNKLSESVTFAMGDIGNAISKAFNLNDAANNVVNLMADIKSAFTENKDVAIALGFIVDKLSTAFQLLGNVIIFAVNAFQMLTSAFNTVMKAGEPVRNFISNLAVGSFEYIKSIKGIGTSIDWLVGKFTKIDNVKKVELPKVEAPKLEGLSATPSKKESKPKTQKQEIEIITGTDFITRDEGSKIKRLIELNKDAALKISEIWLTGTEKKLAKLKSDYELEIQDYVKYQVDYTNITKKYEETRKQIIQQAQNERETAAVKAQLEELAGLQMSYPRSLDDFANDLLNNDLINNLKNYGEAFYAATKDFNVNLASGFADIAGNALVTGMSLQDTFKSLGSMVLSSLGDYLIKIGTAAIAAGTVGTILKTFFTGGAATVPELGIAGGMAAVAVGSAMKALSGKVSDSMSKNNMPGKSGSTASSVSSRASGASYQYGGASYATQSIRLMVDLTGSITATQTGYSINKSLETTLRVTGR